MAICKNCNKLGEITGPPGAPKIATESKPCPTCGGRGEVPGRHRICGQCKGWGDVGWRINPTRCSGCNGRGAIFW